MRAAIYCRVSTTRQAEGELSIPDQQKQCEAFCAAKGWEIVRLFTDRGASATTDNRPEFQAMIAEACSRERPFDVILVHSQSRFARNTLDFLFYEKKLAKAGVTLVSITQDFGDSNEAQLLRTMTSVFDEYQSKETAKHVHRSMCENARLGFWNGSKAPFGYRTYTAEKRGAKDKKKIEIHPREAEIVRLIFALYVRGDGKRGPMGMKRITTYLNERGHRNSSGKPFRIQFLQKIPRNTAYIGEHYFNRRDSRTGKEHPRQDWIAFPMPPIVVTELFHAAQARLDRNDPIKTAPRTVSSTVPLSGIAHCAECGSPLKIRTGKSGKYRYYACGRALDEGTARCTGCRIPEALLNEIVLANFAEHVLAPERLDGLLSALVARASERSRNLAERIRALRDEKRGIDKKLENLWDEVGRGVQLDGSLRAYIGKLQEKREVLIRHISRLDSQRQMPLAQLAKAKRETFSKAVRARLSASEPEFRRAYVQAMVSRVELGKETIRIEGPKEALLAQAHAHSANGELVPTFAQQWRSLGESNPSFQIENLDYRILANLHERKKVPDTAILLPLTFTLVRPISPM